MSSLPEAVRALRPPTETVTLFHMVDEAFVGDRYPTPTGPIWSNNLRDFNESLVHAQDPQLVMRAKGSTTSNLKHGIRIARVELELHEAGTVASIVLSRAEMRGYDFAGDPFLKLFSDYLKSHLRGSGSV